MATSLAAAPASALGLWAEIYGIMDERGQPMHPKLPATFEPRLDILPESQRQLWPELDAVPYGFVLYGGTALALQLGHRVSEDFDFFSSAGFDTEASALQSKPGLIAEGWQQ
jgi:hypothetical protein